MNKRGIALIFAFLVIIVLSVLGTAIISRSISESRIASRYAESTQAFWIAEAGANRALTQLRGDFSTTGTGLWSTQLGQGRYSVNVGPTGNPATRVVRTRGCVPDVAGCVPGDGVPCQSRACRDIQLIFSKVVPPGFYDYAIYSAGGIDIRGSSYNVYGNVTYASTLSWSSDRITGSEIPDPSIAPLAALDYNQLRIISQAQGNYFDEDHLDGPFPQTFWFNQTNSVPNVVFLEGPLLLRGNDIMGGFIIVGGAVEYDATLGGTVGVDGCIYTRHDFTANGGGHQGLNINGGVWAGNMATLNGGVNVGYNATYMSAIKNQTIDATIQVSSWRDAQNPYVLQ